MPVACGSKNESSCDWELRLRNGNTEKLRGARPCPLRNTQQADTGVRAPLSRAPSDITESTVGGMGGQSRDGASAQLQ